MPARNETNVGCVILVEMRGRASLQLQHQWYLFRLYFFCNNPFIPVKDINQRCGLDVVEVIQNIYAGIISVHVDGDDFDSRLLDSYGIQILHFFLANITVVVVEKQYCVFAFDGM